LRGSASIGESKCVLLSCCGTVELKNGIKILLSW
jgi:hypothetical protein